MKGVKIAGLMFDAGSGKLPSSAAGWGLSTLRTARRARTINWSDPADPSSLQDVFFRIGGATPGKATNSLVVNADNVILDDIWAWRADHGNGVGWTENTADTGLIVNGDNVTAYGLFVEHYQKYDLDLERRERQDDLLPERDALLPAQPGCREHDGVKGYAAYKVGDDVQTHEAGMGSYTFFKSAGYPRRARLRSTGCTRGQAARYPDRVPER